MAKTSISWAKAWLALAISRRLKEQHLPARQGSILLPSATSCDGVIEAAALQVGEVDSGDRGDATDMLVLGFFACEDGEGGVEKVAAKEKSRQGNETWASPGRD